MVRLLTPEQRVKLMSLRIFSALGLMGALAACGSGDVSPEPVGDAVTCAIGEGVEMSDVCTLERVAGDGSATFLIHHPDGGFRRVSLDPETQELGVVDGADSLRITDSSDDITEFTIGIDRYRVENAVLLRADPAR